MIEGLLRHCTDADLDTSYVDTPGASVVGFAFTELLGFRLLPRLKNIGTIRLYQPVDTGTAYARLGAVLTRPPRPDENRVGAVMGEVSEPQRHSQRRLVGGMTRAGAWIA